MNLQKKSLTVNWAHFIPVYSWTFVRWNLCFAFKTHASQLDKCRYRRYTCI